MLKKLELVPDLEKDFNKIYDDSFIDVDKPIEHQPIALSFGTKLNEYTPIVTYGNFMCIVGASKSMKTFLKTAFLAGYLGGQTKKYFNELVGHNISNKYVLDFDTEQSEFHAQKSAKRVIKMTGKSQAYYKPFMLRPYSAKERVEFIEYLFNESDFKGRIGLCSIDGVADLVDNVNDLDKSNAVVQKLMKLTEENNCAMITVLHKNYDSDKPTGHLGSAILKKSETVLFVNKQSEIVNVKSKYSRNNAIDEFNFHLNVDSLPELVDSTSTIFDTN